MVSFYSPEALKVISDHLYYIPSPQKSDWTDQRSNQPTPAEERAALILWLTSLPHTELEKAVMVHSRPLCHLLFQLHFKQLIEGELEIALKPGKPMGDLSESFDVRKRKGDSHKSLEALLRLTDTSEYLDSLTLDTDFLASPQDLLQYLSGVSKDQHFRTQCQSGTHPGWFDPHAYHSLSEWAGAFIERAIWQRFRGHPSQPGHFTGKLRSEKESFSKTLGDLRVFQEEYQSLKKQLYPCLQSIVTYWNSDDLPSNDLDESSRQIAMFYQSSSSFELLFTNYEVLSSADYIDFLRLTPLERTTSILDVVCRKVLLKLTSPKQSLSQASSSTATPVKSPSQNGQDYKFIREVVQELVQKSLNCQGFQLVSKPKRKKNKKQQHKANSKQKPPQKRQQRSRPVQKPVCRVISFGPSRLHGQILDFVAEVRQKTAQKFQAVSLIITHVHHLVNMLFPGARLMLFGSYATGLAIESSDVDLQVFHPAYVTKEAIKTALSQLEFHLAYVPWVSHHHCIATASVPVIKLEASLAYFASEGTLKADITFDDSPGALDSVHLGIVSLDYTKKSLETHKALAYLMIPLKSLLANHEFNQAYTGGISSYSLLVWILAYLNTTKDDANDYGVLLTGFLKMYSQDFDPQKMSISAEGLTEKKEASVVVTQDPVRVTHNATRTSYNVQKVLGLFKHAYNLLYANSKLKDVLKA